MNGAFGNSGIGDRGSGIGVKLLLRRRAYAGSRVNGPRIPNPESRAMARYASYPTTKFIPACRAL